MKINIEIFKRLVKDGDKLGILRCLQIDGNVLKFVPNPSAELCLTAVQRNGDALEYVPENLRKNVYYALRERFSP